MDFSVIIVTYNVENIIDSCLESLAGQTFKNFEAIIVDNNYRFSSFITHF